MRKSVIGFFVSVAAGLCFAESGKPWTMIYLDCNCTQIAHVREGLSVAALERTVDAYTQGPVTHLLINPNGQRAWYPSKVLERQWDSLREPGVKTNWLTVAVLTQTEGLFNQGIDLWDVMLQRARKRGAKGWITMRMNDSHGVTKPDSVGTSILYLRRPDLRRDPTDHKPNSYPPKAFNYAKKEVRELYTAAALEMLERYDADGFDADWTRFPWYLTPGKEREESHYLTEVMRAIRKKAREMEKLRGHPITVSATVMSDPGEALSHGTDVFQWAREGLVDVVTVANFFFCVNFKVPFREWCDRLHAIDPKIRVVPRTDTSVIREGRQKMTLAEYCGWFERLQEMGCNDFAFFNFFAWQKEPVNAPGLRQLVMVEGITPDRVRAQPRSYPVTKLDSQTYNPHFPFGRNLYPKEVTIEIGSTRGVKAVSVDAGFAEMPPAAGATLTLNGVEALASDPECKPPWLKGNGVKAVVRCTFPVSALKDGVNTVAFVGHGKARPCFCEIHVDPGVQR